MRLSHTQKSKTEASEHLGFLWGKDSGSDPEGLTALLIGIEQKQNTAALLVAQEENESLRLYSDKNNS